MDKDKKDIAIFKEQDASTPSDEPYPVGFGGTVRIGTHSYEPDEDVIVKAEWVARRPDYYEGSTKYPGGVEFHNWHDNVEMETKRTSRIGGRYENMLAKQPGKDYVAIVVERREETYPTWHYLFLTH